MHRLRNRRADGDHFLDTAHGRITGCGLLIADCVCFGCFMLFNQQSAIAI
jgi:hypothetical protein